MYSHIERRPSHEHLISSDSPPPQPRPSQPQVITINMPVEPSTSHVQRDGM